MAVTLRAVRGGVVTGVLLAVARMIGETAPLLFTALNNQFFSLDLGRAELASGHLGAALIALIVLAINITARVVFRDKVQA